MNLGVYFGYMGAKPPGRIEPKIFLEEGIRDVITCFKFGEDRFRGLASAEGQILPFPIDFDGRPYNNHTTVWACDLNEQVVWLWMNAPIFTSMATDRVEVWPNPKNVASLFYFKTDLNRTATFSEYSIENHTVIPVSIHQSPLQSQHWPWKYHVLEIPIVGS